MKKKIGILVSGRGSNMLAIIKASKESTFPGEVAIVISDNPDAPALKKAQDNGVKAVYIDPGRKGAYLSTQAETQYAEVLKKHGVDIVVLAGFMRIIRKPLLSAFPNSIINIHPSLLPAFPGLNAQKQALDYGVKVAGCTVHFVNEDVDAGPIIIQSCVPVLQDDTPETLSQRILKEEHKILVEAVKLLCEERIKIEGRKVLILPQQG